MSNVLIAGCGFVGSALAGLLLEDGDRVWGLRREVSDLPSAVEPLAIDLRTRGFDLPRPLDFVVFAAAADRSDEAAYRDTYVDGLQHLLDALADQRNALQRVLFTSSTGVYAQTDGSWVDEASPTEPQRATGQVLLEAEQRVLRSDFPATVVRFAGIYGPGRRRMIEMVKAGEASCRPDISEYMNRIHRDDCAGVLRHLLRLANPAPLYVAADHEPTERCAFLHWLAAQLSAPPPPVGPPSPRPRGFSNKRCHNGRLRESGYTFRFPTYREGYADVLATGR